MESAAPDSRAAPDVADGAPLDQADASMPPTDASDARTAAPDATPADAGPQLPPAVLAISPTSKDYGSVVVGTSGSADFDVTNTGGQAAGAPSATMVGFDATQFAVASTTCGSTLAPGAHCTVTARFAPTAAGARRTELTVTANPGGTATSDLTGTAVTPAALSITPTTKDYSVVVLGMNASADFQITNTGGQTTGVPSAPALTSGDVTQFAVTASTCTVALAAGERCTVTVRFSPTSIGAKSTQLAVSATPGGTVTAGLSGTAVVAGFLTISPVSASFGSLLPGASSPATTFTVTNAGGATTGTLATAVVGSTDFKIMGNTCAGVMLPAAGTCTISVVLMASAAGPESATLTVTATPGGTTSVGLTGTAQHPALLSITPTTFAFSNTELAMSSPTRSFSITNTGDVSAGTTTALSGTIIGANPTEFGITANTCTGTLGPNGTCQVVVGFTPTIVGNRAATLTVNASPGGSVSATLAGTGLRPPAISGAPASLDFGRVEIGAQTDARVWTITNSGDVATGALTFSNTNPSEVLVTNDCIGSLAGGMQCTVSVSVKASAAGTRSGTLSVTGLRGGTATLSVTSSAGYRLTVNPSGTGTVTTSPAGLSCGTTCTAIFDVGTVVTLQARTTNGSNAFFCGWSGGGCSGPFRDCTVTLSSSISTAAMFSSMTNNLIFVTSGGFMTNEGSAANYDKDCNLAATAAGINDAAGTSYVAFTTDATTSVAGRLGTTARGWVRMDGKPFSDLPSDLFNGNEVLNSIRYTEVGQVAGSAVTLMTGAQTNGVASNNCANYAVLTGDSILCGSPEGGPGRYTDTGALCHASCGGPYRIICMGKSKTVPLMYTAAMGRRIWLDSTVFINLFGSMGQVSSPDQVCQAERPAGVTTAAALLAYSNRPASGLLSPTVNYVRLDGVLVGTGAQLAAAGPLESGIWQEASGAYRVGGGQAGIALTGGLGGSLTNTCNDWTSLVGTGVTGDFSSTDGGTWWNLGTTDCGHVPTFFYCVQTAP
jgi:hypothetical protein